MDLAKVSAWLYEQTGCACSKVVVEIFTAPEPYAYLRTACGPDRTTLNLFVYAAWLNLGESEPDPANQVSFLPDRVDDFAARLEIAGKLAFADFLCLDADEDAFEARWPEVTAAVEAKKALVELADLHGWGSQTMRILQILPELKFLRLVAPLKGDRPLSWELSREDVVYAFRMGRRYQRRYASLLHREDELALQRLEGNLTKREAGMAQEAIDRIETQFMLDLYEEFAEHLRRSR